MESASLEERKVECKKDKVFCKKEKSNVRKISLLNQCFLSRYSKIILFRSVMD